MLEHIFKPKTKQQVHEALKHASSHVVFTLIRNGSIEAKYALDCMFSAPQYALLTQQTLLKGDVGLALRIVNRCNELQILNEYTSAAISTLSSAPATSLFIDSLCVYIHHPYFDASYDNNALLVWASMIGNTDLVNAILEKGVDPSHPNNIAFHAAINYNNMDVAKILIEDNRVKEKLDTPLNNLIDNEYTKT